MKPYNNLRAMGALIRASLQSIIKSPSAIVFSIAFPLVFILVFGFLGEGGGKFSMAVAPAKNSDTSNALYAVLKNIPVLKWKQVVDADHAMRDGDIAATISIQPQPEGGSHQYEIVLNTVSSQVNKIAQLKSIINEALLHLDPEIKKRVDAMAAYDVHIAEVRDFKMIDFILPGQLGFSLLASGVFGTAFVFFNLRQTLVLKRFFATPVRREIIVLSEGIARMIFQLIGAVIIISIGHFAFGFTLINGLSTFLQMLAVCGLGMMVFMGFGFIISGLAKSESAIPPFSNLITLPQFLLAGTFFSIDNFPKWLQPICKALPLTYLNDALRKIAFDGAGFMEIQWDLLILLVWGIVIYTIASRVFKWE